MQIIVCKLVVLLFGQNNKAPKPKQCLSATGTNKMLQHAGRIMKLTAVLLLGVCMQIYAAGYGQRITLSERDVPIEKVLKKIQQQTTYKFLYTSQLLQRVPKVTVVVKDATVEDVLDLVLKGQMLDYEVSEGTVVIRAKKEAPAKETTQTYMPDPIEIRGVITDENGAPASGVNVMVKGTSKGTTTNLRGEFVLRDVSENAVLLITSVGYDRQEILVKGKDLITTQLRVAVGNLDEMQVIGYGTTTKRLNTGNVNTVKGTELAKQPVNNPLLGLEGRVPGLFITQNSGIANGGVTVRIQGKNSIISGNDPLYIIDGVPYYSQIPRTGIDEVLGNSGDPLGSGNPLSYIDVSNIESIDVLKDADATAIYGSRAANGAILITTKKGKSGRPKFDINMKMGWGEVANEIDMLNRDQYLAMRYEAFKNDGINWMSNLVSANDLKVWDTNQNTNWQDEIIGNTAYFSNYNASLSGGTSNIQYLLSGNYYRETTVFPLPRSFADKKASVHFNLNTTSPRQKLKMQLSCSYMVDNNRLPATDLTANAIRLEPIAPSIYTDDGSLNWAPNPSGASTFNNPLQSIYTKYKNKTINMVTNLVLSYFILPDLKVSTSLGYTNMQTKDYIPYPLLAVRPEDRLNSQRRAVYGDRNLSSWIIEPQVNYKKKISHGDFELLVGSTILQNDNNTGYLQGSGHISDQVLEDIHAAAAVGIGSTQISQYKYNALFARANYNWKDKFIVNFTGRRDGSSRFGEANQFHNFGALGVGWIFSNEPIIKNALSFMTFGKIRASFGTTGNDLIGDYSFLSLYNRYGNAPIPYQGIVSLVPSGLPNPKLQWEETKKIQVGIDLSFLENKVSLNATYANNQSSNQLLNYRLPLTTGFGSLILNFPAKVGNTSWEFSINTTNISNKDFSWSSSLNVTIPRNKLLEFPNLSNSTYASDLVIGEPITLIKTYRYAGVDQTTGDYQFFDSLGNYTSTPIYPNEATDYKNTLPTIYGGFLNTIRFKGFQFDFLFQFVRQVGSRMFFNNGSIVGPGVFLNGVSNQPITVLDRWQNKDDVASVRRFSTGLFSSFLQLNNVKASNAAFEDASFIRLKNVSLSWQIPAGLRRKAAIKDCSVYIQGQNLLTITDYKGLDPETQTVNALPPLRVIMVGIQVGL